MPKYREIFHQTLAVMTVGFNEFCNGMAMGWMAPTLTALKKPDSILPLSISELSWIAAIDNFGKLIGCVLSAIFMDIIGRSPLLAFSALLFPLTWLLIYTKSVFTILTMRFLYGIASGIETGINAAYIGENSSPAIRSIFGTVVVALYNLGIFVEFIIASYLPYQTAGTVNLVIQSIAFLAVFLIREPPQFLLMKGHEKRALENFMWLKGITDPKDVKNEFEKIKLNVQAEKLKQSSIKVALTTVANYKSVLIMFTLSVLTGMTGYMTVLSFATVTFASSNILTPNEFTILLGATVLVMVIVASFIISRFERRFLLLTTFSLIAFVHACTALLYYVHENHVRLPYFPWLIFFAISLYAAVNAFSYPTIFIIRSELFPLSIRAWGTCISIAGFYMTNFVLTKVFLIIYETYGIYLNFLFFSISGCLMVLFVYFMVPETRNKSLLEIQEILEKQK